MAYLDTALANLATRIDLRKATILLIEANPQAMEVLAQVFSGFGAKGILKATNFEEAQQAARSGPVDLIVCEGILKLGEADGYEFACWLRRSNLQPNAFAPMIMVSSHTSRRNVTRARDCGAHFVVTKPLAPAVLLDRILWIAQANRIFVTCDDYSGPDRRFQNLGPPGDTSGRRSSDLTEAIGQAVDPNMSQDEIDNLLPMKRAAR